MSDCVDMATRVLDHHEIQYTVERNKHFKITIDHGGVKKILCTATSPSDRRGVLNFYSVVRRTIRELGLEFKADSKELIHN